jgi:hypothetical protein
MHWVVKHPITHPGESYGFQRAAVDDRQQAAIEAN